MKCLFARKDIAAVDYGRAEYLDGVLMRYYVENISDRQDRARRVIAFFENEEDAIMFAKAKARRRDAVNMISGEGVTT